MGFQTRNDKVVLIALCGILILNLFVFTPCQCKTVGLKEEAEVSGKKGGNVLVSLAKSVASEALSEFQARARRNPKLGFNITMLLPPNVTGNNNSYTLGSLGDSASGAASGLLPSLGLPTQLGVIGLKGGILGIKAAVIQTAVLVLFILFLVTGIFFFACSVGVINCSSLTGGGGGGGGGLGNLGGGLGQISNPFSRNGYDYQSNLQRSTSSVYNAIDDGQKKYT